MGYVNRSPGEGGKCQESGWLVEQWSTGRFPWDRGSPDPMQPMRGWPFWPVRGFAMRTVPDILIHNEPWPLTWLGRPGPPGSGRGGLLSGAPRGFGGKEGQASSGGKADCGARGVAGEGWRAKGAGSSRSDRRVAHGAREWVGGLAGGGESPGGRRRDLCFSRRFSPAVLASEGLAAYRGDLALEQCCYRGS